MSAERFMEKAATALRSYLASNLGGKLDAIESEQSLSSGLLADPEFITADVPNDMRSPLCEVMPLRGEPINQREGLWRCLVGVAIGWSSDADMEGGTRQIMRYHSALLKTVLASPSLGSTVGTCQPRAFDYTADRASSAVTRFTVMQDFEIHIQDA